MNTYQILILTDHKGHSAENSVYPLAKAIYQHPSCQFVDICSRGVASNKSFFEGQVDRELSVLQVRPELDVFEARKRFDTSGIQSSVFDYDVIMLRLPPPIPVSFLDTLCQEFQERFIINRPSGILLTGSKEFLLNFPELCPPMCLVDSPETLRAFAAKFPIVLKPLKGYGGQGIVKLEKGEVQDADHAESLDAFLEKWESGTRYLGMQFLKNVDQGDKRIVVCNGEILGASLRLPKEGDWICNVSLGGTSVQTEITPEEEHIAAEIWPVMKSYGILLFGFDTLVNDEGRRVLSEINSSSVGGLPQMQAQTGKPVLARAAQLIMKYIDEISYGNIFAPS